MDSKVKVLNVKENNSSPDYAQYLLDCEIRDAKTLGTGVIIVIHGYGSHGKGGVTKQQIVDYLTQMVKQKNIKAFVKGEEWGQLSETVKTMCSFYPSLVLHSQIQRLNSGVSIVWVQ